MKEEGLRIATGEGGGVEVLLHAGKRTGFGKGFQALRPEKGPAIEKKMEGNLSSTRKKEVNV